VKEKTESVSFSITFKYEWANVSQPKQNQF